jgi:hypothetical protein
MEYKYIGFMASSQQPTNNINGGFFIYDGSNKIVGAIVIKSRPADGDEFFMYTSLTEPDMPYDFTTFSKTQPVDETAANVFHISFLDDFLQALFGVSLTVPSSSTSGSSTLDNPASVTTPTSPPEEVKPENPSSISSRLKGLFSSNKSSAEVPKESTDLGVNNFS